jgi:nitroimidazol reductase NimA-like FMN-containing flavoprotein (pyridoxamine 5'-phosphate oxidase superfamily)
MKQTNRSELRRMPTRGSHDWDTISQILDLGFLAHVGFSVDRQPLVIPTLYGRRDETLYLHGSAASRMLGKLETGIQACVNVTLVDGIVLARSAFHHSMNYRSVVAFGTARKVEDPDCKVRCLQVISEHLIRGRWAEVRAPSTSELMATTVLEFLIDEASSKVRSGPPVDDENDWGLPVWAGVLPLAIRSQEPIPDSQLPAGVDLPTYVSRFDARLSGQERSIDTEKIPRLEATPKPMNNG